MTLTFASTGPGPFEVEGTVLRELCQRYPFGMMPAEVRTVIGIRHPQRVGGIIRFLRNRGLAERGPGGRVFASYAAFYAWRMFR